MCLYGGVGGGRVGGGRVGGGGECARVRECVHETERERLTD